MGLFLSLFVASCLGFFAWYIAYEVSSYSSYDMKLPKKYIREESDSDEYYARKMRDYKEKKSEFIKSWALLVIMPVFIAVISLIGCFYIGYRSNVSTCRGYEAKVEAYSAAIENESIEGLEKLSLVENVANLNADLLQYKETASKWYGFMIPDDLLDDIEPVDLSGIK